MRVFLAGVLGGLLLARSAQAQAPVLADRFADYVKAHAHEHVLEGADLNRRLDEMNLLRHQIESERGTYITRAEHEVLRADMERSDMRMRENLGKLSTEIAALQTTVTTWGAALAVFFVVLQVGLQIYWHQVHGAKE